MLCLGTQLGPVLWQIQEAFKFNASRLDAFCSLLPKTLGEAAALARRRDDKLTAERACVELPPGTPPST